jgi:DNA-binding transcriptional LysR family regulator
MERNWSPSDEDLIPELELTPPAVAGDIPRDATSLQTSWLRSFLAVVDNGGFGAATMPLHLSQSRVSAHISALEHALGVVLFDRKARPTTTTEAGELFRSHALAALNELQRGVDAARGTRLNLVARATIGSYPSVSSSYLSAVLRQLRARHPSVSVDLIEGTEGSLDDLVVRGVVDLAFKPLHARIDPNLSHRTIWREDIVAVMPEDDDLATRTSVTIHDLLGRPLIGNPAGSEMDRDGLDLRGSLGEAAEGSGIAYLTDQPTTLVALVRSAFGIGVINRLGLETMSTQGLAIRTIASPTAHRNIAVFWQRRRSDRAVVRALLEAQAAAALPLGVFAPS